MLALLLVAGTLAVMFLGSLAIGLLLGRAVRHGEQQARRTRHTDPHAAYWGAIDPEPQPHPDRPAGGHTGPRHRRDR